MTPLKHPKATRFTASLFCKITNESKLHSLGYFQLRRHLSSKRSRAIFIEALEKISSLSGQKIRPRHVLACYRLKYQFAHTLNEKSTELLSSATLFQEELRVIMQKLSKCTNHTRCACDFTQLVEAYQNFAKREKPWRSVHMKYKTEEFKKSLIVLKDAREITYEDTDEREFFDWKIWSLLKRANYALGKKKAASLFDRCHFQEMDDYVVLENFQIEEDIVVNEVLMKPCVKVSEIEYYGRKTKNMRLWEMRAEAESETVLLNHGDNQPIISVVANALEVMKEPHTFCDNVHFLRQQLQHDALDFEDLFYCLIRNLSQEFPCEKKRHAVADEWKRIKQEPIGLQSVSSKCSAILLVKELIYEIRVLRLEKHVERLKPRYIETGAVYLQQALEREYKGMPMKNTVQVMRKALESNTLDGSNIKIMASFLLESLDTFKNEEEDEFPETLFLNEFRMQKIFNILASAASTIAMLLTLASNPITSVSEATEIKRFVKEAFFKNKEYHSIGFMEDSIKRKYLRCFGKYPPDIIFMSLNSTNAVNVLVLSRLKQRIMNVCIGAGLQSAKDAYEAFDKDVLSVFDIECCQQMRRLLQVQMQAYGPIYDRICLEIKNSKE